MCAPAAVLFVAKAAAGAAITYGASKLLSGNDQQSQQVRRNEAPPTRLSRQQALLQEDSDLRDETTESERSKEQKLARMRRTKGTKNLAAKSAPGTQAISDSIAQAPPGGITPPTGGMTP